MIIGTQILADIIVNKHIFDNVLHKYFFVHFDEQIQTFLIKNNMILLNKIIHFVDGPNGTFTALYLLSESHLSFHSWPEYNYIAIDIFTSTSYNPENIISDICYYLEAKLVNIKILTRNIPN
jgi:S-adenosylmethionine/arginine decarboxylase-like enzyme